MTARRIMGIETEYGVSAPGDPSANAMLMSSQVVNAYAAPLGSRAGRARWDYEDEAPLRDARGWEVSRDSGALQPAHRRPRRPRSRQRHPHERRPAVRRPRAPGVLVARDRVAAGRRPLGQGGGAGHAHRRPPHRQHPRPRRREHLQEQHGQQGRLVRHARELPDAPRDPVRRRRQAPDPVLRLPPGDLRRRPGRQGAGGRHGRVPDQPAGRLLRGRGGPRDDAQAPDHQHPRRAARERRPLPPPARDHRRRDDVRGRDVPQDGHDRAGPAADRGPRLHPRPRRRAAGAEPAPRLARPDAQADR